MDEAWLAPPAQGVGLAGHHAGDARPSGCRERGGPHFGSPDKVPAVRLATLEAAGRARVPFTTGILIGIGETRAERIEALLAIRDLHERHGHIQEVIIQNFRAKPGTRMADAPEPTLEEHLWTIAVARLIFGPAMNIQAPPNLQPDGLGAADPAPASTTGAASRRSRPTTSTPRRPGRISRDLERATRARRPHPGRAAGDLSRRYLAPSRNRTWLEPVLRHARSLRLRRMTRGLARATDALVAPVPREPLRRDAGRAHWVAQRDRRVPARASLDAHARPRRRADGRRCHEAEIVALFDARGSDFAAVCGAADELRARARRRHGHLRRSTATSTTPTSAPTAASSAPSPRAGTASAIARQALRLDLDEIARAHARGLGSAAPPRCACRAASSPSYTGDTYLVDRRRGEVGGARHARARLLAAGDLARRRRRSGCRCATISRALKDAGLGQPARHRGGDPRRRGARRSSAPTRSTPPNGCEVMETAHAVGLQKHRHHHVRPRRRLPALGAPPAARARAAGARPAASPSSCRCPSCTWRRRSISRARRARARPSARRC